MSVPPRSRRGRRRASRARRPSRSPRARAASRSRAACAARERSCVFAGSMPALAAASMNLAEVPKTATRSRSRQIEEHARVRMERRAVVEHERRAGREARHQPVPHHPAGRREVEEPVVRLQVDVQAGAPSRAGAASRRRRAGCTWARPWCRRSRARRADDRTGSAGTPARARGSPRARRPRARRRGSARDPARSPVDRHDHDALERGELAPDLGHARERVEALARVARSRPPRTGPWA